jgi:S-formylglutathione hydrolase FrmB
LYVCGLAAALLLASAASADANAARITAKKRIAPRVVELTISTPAFTAPTHVDVDLPVGYDADRERRWPVAYFLAGTMNTYASFNAVVHGVELSKSFPAIIVSPNGDSGYWSDWYNGGAFGPPEYETYVIEQLIPLIDHHFRTIPERSQRAVAGVSMGGYGSMMFAARHPDLFADAASISGAVDSNPAPLAAALSVSPTFQEGEVDAIYGPRATQEIRWRGHNPTDLADNLRGLDLQVRTANGIPNPAIGEELLSADSVSCVIEGGVHIASVDFHEKLTELAIPHLWEVFTEDFERPPAPPSPFDYESIEPEFDVWGWHVGADPGRAVEELQLQGVSAEGLTLVGSGTTSVTTPPLFPGVRLVELHDAVQSSVRPDRKGRLHFTVDLGQADTQQQDTLGAVPAEVRRSVTFTPSSP